MLDLRAHLTANVGGTAGQVLEPESCEQLVECVRSLREFAIPFRILGGGSNVIAADGEHEHTFVCTRRLDAIVAHTRTCWRIECGADLMSLCTRTAREGLTGLECCAGIPGTVGAAVRINAGGKFGTIAPLVRTVRLLRRGGAVEQVEAKLEDFSYRHSRFFGDILLDVELEFAEDEPDVCRRRIKEVLLHKKQTQPLKFPSAGCIFRNPVHPDAAGKPISAGKLIDDAGLKGHRIGGAEVSNLHANYMINVGDATGEDFLALIDVVRQRVKDHSGVWLELEVDLWRD